MALYHGKSLMDGMKKIGVQRDDIHAKLMRNYPEAPEWRYISAFCFYVLCGSRFVGFLFFFSFFVRWLIVYFLS